MYSRGRKRWCRVCERDVTGGLSFLASANFGLVTYQQVLVRNSHDIGIEGITFEWRNCEDHNQVARIVACFS